MEEAKVEAGEEGVVEEEAEAEAEEVEDVAADAAVAEDTTGPNICRTTIPCGGDWAPTLPAAEARAGAVVAELAKEEEAILLPTAI